MGAMRGSFRLTSQAHGRGRYALVGVDLEDNEDVQIAVSQSSFSWLRESHPTANIDLATYADFVEAARAGAEYALLQISMKARVVIHEIRFTNVDTSSEDVKYASAFAVWDALGQQPGVTPSIVESGIRFP